MTSLAYTVEGAEDGPVLALVHGFMSSRLQWELNTARLGRRHRLVLIELPGHGQSVAPDDPESYRPPAVLAALDAIRNALALDRWWLVGHSMGGAISARYALRYPDATAGLVTTNSRAIFGVGGSAGPSRPTGPDLRRLPFHPIHAKRFPADLKARMVTAADDMAPFVIDHIGTAAPDWRSGDDLHRLRVPTLLVNGVWEKAFQPHAEHVRNHLPGIVIVDLDGGHSINIEQAEAFDRAVLDFVSEAG
ncbi:MAG: alpha/beta fold hydrolase [Actinomycetota bacterium]